MKTYDFVQLAILATGGEVKGATKLQKTVYFLGILAGMHGQLGYRAHFYGPYSPEVAEAVNRLKGLGFLDQTLAGGGLYDARGFEVVRSDYRLNEGGTKIATEKAQQHPEQWAKVKKGAEILRKAGDRDYVKLSIAAKTYFMIGEKGKATMVELAELAKSFGWSVTPDEAKEAAEFLRKIGLVGGNA